MLDFSTNLVGEHVEIRSWQWRSSEPPPEGILLACGVVRGIGSMIRSPGSELILIVEIDVKKGPRPWGGTMGRIPDRGSCEGYLVPIPWDDHIGVRLVPKEPPELPSA